MATADHVERVLVGGASRRSSDLVVTLLSALAIALPLVFYLSQHVEMLQYGYEIDALEERKVELQERRQRLRADRARSADLERLEVEAARLGLRAPSPEQVFVVRDGGARGGRPSRGGSGLD